MNTNSTLVPITIATVLFASLVTTAVIGGDDATKLGPLESITLSGDKDLTMQKLE